MINWMRIRNFRSHEDTLLEFVPGVNAIVGRGQAGKTNVKRALEWVKDNRPLGKKFMSWWANGEPTEVDVCVTTPEGPRVVIMIKQGDSSATYRIMDGERVVEEFGAVGTKVPEQIKSVLSLDTVNVQGQLDQPYMVTGNKADISRAVNRVIQAEIADRWLTELNSRSTKADQLVKALELTIDTQHAAVNRLSAVHTAEDWIVKAELEDTRLGVAIRRADGIGHLLSTLDQAEATVARFKGIVDPLTQMVTMAEAAQAELDNAMAVVAAVNNMERSEQYVRELAEQHQRVADQYVALLEELGQCPTCLSPVDEAMITQLKEAL